MEKAKTKKKKSGQCHRLPRETVVSLSLEILRRRGPEQPVPGGPA